MRYNLDRYEFLNQVLLTWFHVKKTIGNLQFTLVIILTYVILPRHKQHIIYSKDTLMKCLISAKSGCNADVDMIILRLKETCGLEYSNS